MVKFAKKQTCAKILWLNGKNPFPKAIVSVRSYGAECGLYMVK